MTPLQNIKLCITITLLFTVFTSPAFSTEKPYIAILTLDVSGGIPASYAPAFTDRLRMEVFKTDAFQVMERNEMDEILKEIGFQMTGCSSNECVIQAGRVLGVGQMVAGSISRIGEIYSISLRVIDVETAKILRVENVDCMGTVEEILTLRIQEAAQKLAGMDEGLSIGATEFLGKGNITIESTPAGADIFLDGHETKQKTPAVIEDISAGKHIIRIEKGDLVGAKQIFILPDITSKTAIQLKAGFGALTLISEPAGGKVVIDGEAMGITPVEVDTFPAGKHTLSLYMDGYEEHHKEVRVVANRRLNLNVQLQKLCGLCIKSAPAGAKVKINGKRFGKTPITTNDLAIGEHYVSLSYPGFQRFGTKVALESGQVDSVRKALVPRSKTGSVLMSAFLPGSGQIYSGNSLRGLAIMAGQIFSAGIGYSYADQHRMKVADYNSARESYKNAIYSDEIEAARTAMEDAYEESEDYRKLRNNFLGLAAAIYLYNMIDIMFINDYPVEEPWEGFHFSTCEGESMSRLKISYGF